MRAHHAFLFCLILISNASYAQSFDTLASVQTGGELGKWGYINRTGKFVIEPQFSEAMPFSEALAPVEFMFSAQDTSAEKIEAMKGILGAKKITGGIFVNYIYKWGYIDNTGTTVIPPGMTKPAPSAKALLLSLSEKSGAT